MTRPQIEQKVDPSVVAPVRCADSEESGADAEESGADAGESGAWLGSGGVHNSSAYKKSMVSDLTSFRKHALSHWSGKPSQVVVLCGNNTPHSSLGDMCASDMSTMTCWHGKGQ